MAAQDDAVHLLFGIQAARLKVLDQPVQNHKSFLALDRDAVQATRDVDKCFEHALAILIPHRPYFPSPTAILQALKLSDLVTCIVQRSGSRWDVDWASDGKAPKNSSADSLTAALDEAALQVASLYANHPEALGAELQFAIYPWKGNAGDVILDMTRDGGELVATDIQGSGITFRATSFDAIVEGAERYVPDTSKAMLRWIRRVSDLPG